MSYEIRYYVIKPVLKEVYGRTETEEEANELVNALLSQGVAFEDIEVASY